MKNFFRCKRCFFPNTKPSLHFDKDGICLACKFTDYHENEINWDKAAEEFDKICKKIKKETKGNYDCIIPVSGGKDSTYQTHVVTKIGGLKPLLVSFEPSYPTKIGEENLNNLSKTYGCDVIQLKKSKSTYRKLAKAGFEIIGDHEWPNHVGIYSWPIRMAVQMDIKPIFWGELPGLIGMGRWDFLIKQKKINRDWVEEHVGMNGLRLNDILEFDKTLSKKDVLPYTYPDTKMITKKKLQPYLTGQFFKWDWEKVVKFIKDYGWKEGKEKIEGDYGCWEDQDCGFMPMHQYFKFIKYGYGRATDHVSYQIRRKRMTRAEGKDLIIENEGKVPKKFFIEFLEFLNIDEKEFIRVRDKFTNPTLFKQDNQDRYILSNNDIDLTLRDEWFNSFDK